MARVSFLDGLKRVAIRFVNRIGPLRRFVSRRVINHYAYAAQARPRSISMAADYATWPGLVERRYSGRHLPPAVGTHAPAHPDLDKTVELFRRQSFTPAADTNTLFPMFAQWFVDGFLRTKWEPADARTFRENESNHEIDLNQIYGAGEAQTAVLRAHEGGRLRTQEINGEIWPAPLFEANGNGEIQLADRFAVEPGLYTEVNFERVYNDWSDDQKRFAFAVGLEHGNSTVGQAVMNTLFVREHNRTAGLLAKAHPDWDDERLFQTARNVTIVVLLNIVIGDYIVHIAPLPLRLEAIPGMAEKEHWYRTNWIAVEFALLYRWHDLIPDGMTVSGTFWPAHAFRRANEPIVSAGLDAVLRAAATERAGRIGLHNSAPFLADRDKLDIKGLSLLMGRTCRLASFNDYRRHFGLSPYKTFDDLTGDPAITRELENLYGDIEKLEWFIGLFAEGYGDGSMMGELMTKMVANDAFTQALTNPLLARHVHNEETFGKPGMEIVNTTKTLAEVIVRNTGLTNADDLRFELNPL